jgi:hypothetical protein
LNDNTIFQESPVFLCGHRKSGTTLLLNLLDSHPNLSVYPADSGFFFKYYPLCELENYSKNKKIDEMIKTVIKSLADEFLKLSSSEMNSIGFNMEKFKTDFKKLVKKTDMTPRDMLISLQLAFQHNHTNSSNPKMWIEKTTSTEIYALDIIDWFPNAKFIHVIRDPRDNWGSLKSGWDKRYKNFNDSKERLLQSLIERGKLGMEFAKHNQTIFNKDQYLIIKFEDLTSNPQKILKKICNFLKIPFDDILLTPTICGKLWKGNNFDGKKFTSISSTNVDRWKKRITEHEAKLIEYHYSDMMKFFNYKLTYDSKEQSNAAKEHYKWYNYAQPYSYTTTRNNQ